MQFGSSFHDGRPSSKRWQENQHEVVETKRIRPASGDYRLFVGVPRAVARRDDGYSAGGQHCYRPRCPANHVVRSIAA